MAEIKIGTIDNIGYGVKTFTDRFDIIEKEVNNKLEQLKNSTSKEIKEIKESNIKELDKLNKELNEIKDSANEQIVKLDNLIHEESESLDRKINKLEDYVDIKANAIKDFVYISRKHTAIQLINNKIEYYKNIFLLSLLFTISMVCILFYIEYNIAIRAIVILSSFMTGIFLRKAHELKKEKQNLESENISND